MDFDDYCNAFTTIGTLTNPAELQAALCGRCCGGQRLSNAEVLQIAADLLDVDEGDIGSIHNALLQMYTDTLAQLTDNLGVFELLLPDDDEPLAARIETLTGWCRNYLSGLGQSGLSGNLELSPDASEAMRDMAAIATADSGVDGGDDEDVLDPYSDVAVEPDEQDEVSYFELVEYVRVAVALIFSEMGSLDDSKGKTLH